MMFEVQFQAEEDDSAGSLSVGKLVEAWVFSHNSLIFSANQMFIFLIKLWAWSWSVELKMLPSHHHNNRKHMKICVQFAITALCLRSTASLEVWLLLTYFSDITFDQGVVTAAHYSNYRGKCMATIATWAFSDPSRYNISISTIKAQWMLGKC